MRADTLAVHREAAAALDAAGLAYALTGANALGAYTLGRATYDLDFIVEDPRGPLDRRLPSLQLVERTKDVYFDQEAYIFEVATYVTPIEMFVATHWLTRAALDRRRTIDVPSWGRLSLVRADDAALLKAAVAAQPSRAGKRALDRDDLKRLSDAAPDLDIVWMRDAARRLGSAATTLLQEAGFRV